MGKGKGVKVATTRGDAAVSRGPALDVARPMPTAAASKPVSNGLLTRFSFGLVMSAHTCPETAPASPAAAADL
jgi:hypothetical protein